MHIEAAIISNRSFYSCRTITNVVLNSSLTTIEFEAFAHSLFLVSLVIPANNSLSYIGERAFAFCTKLTTFESLSKG